MADKVDAKDKAPVAEHNPLVLEEDDEFAEFEARTKLFCFDPARSAFNHRRLLTRPCSTVRKGAAQLEDGGCGGSAKQKAAELDEFQADWDDQEVDTDFMNQLREQLAPAGK